MKLSIQFTIKPFDTLTTIELFNIIKARIQVFVVEQNCAYQDLDEADLSAIHIMLQDTNELAGYCRIIPPATNTTNETSIPAIGRVLTLAKHRGNGLARKLMTQTIKYCHTHFPDQDIYISAQTYLIKFYQSLGFISQGTVYLEDNIEHIDMILPFSNNNITHTK